MIAKHIKMEQESRSSMIRLVEYITDPQNKENRIGEVFISNCISTTPEMAALEMLATQDANTKSQADKTYHAVVSFPAGEEPDSFRNEHCSEWRRHQNTKHPIGRHLRYCRWLGQNEIIISHHSYKES